MEDYSKFSLRDSPAILFCMWERMIGVIPERIGKNILEKAVEINNYLIELCKKNNFYLIDNSIRIKLQLLNSSKLHLNKKSSQILSDLFNKEIANIFNWHVKECNSEHSTAINKRDGCINVLS